MLQWWSSAVQMAWLSMSGLARVPAHPSVSVKLFLIFYARTESLDFNLVNLRRERERERGGS